MLVIPNIAEVNPLRRERLKVGTEKVRERIFLKQVSEDVSFFNPGSIVSPFSLSDSCPCGVLTVSSFCSSYDLSKG